MAKNLESLVLVGSTVLRGGKAGNPRAGTSYSANGKTPEIRISLRHPSHREKQEFQPALRPSHADDRMDTVAALGAGRLLRCAGVLSRSSATGSSWSASNGGSQPTTAACLCLKPGRAAAFVSEVTSGRLTTLPATTLAGGVTAGGITVVTKGLADLLWCKPASQTPPASTWGFGVR
ncbi:MAG TPA: hypothetical protein VMG10_19745 [Gemmataceae bacterium]|nr:hypothetical protein [Gemmataceae bacterium]